jgi:hypothetical protein
MATDVEDFLFEVLTLRSNEAYRRDIGTIIDANDQASPRSDWTALYDLTQRPFQAARSVISTWDIICSAAGKKFVAGSAERDYFLSQVPLGNLYAMLKPALDVIKAGNKALPATFGDHFADLGKTEYDKLVTAGVVVGLPADSRFPAAREAYRSADRATRQQTHFG